MLPLPNGCRCSEIAVIPKNWKSAGASTAKPWLIHYRFYDADGNCKQVPIKGMNHIKLLAERRVLTQAFIDGELEKLKAGYNPILGQVVEPAAGEADGDYLINPQAPFITALDKAVELMEALDDTKSDTESVVKFVKKAALDIGKAYTPLSEISRRHILMILKQCEKNRPDKWSNNQFNVYRSNLMMLYDVMLQHEAVQCNFLRDVKKKKVVKRAKRFLTPEERLQVAAHVAAKHPVLWNYIQLFFHSGARTKELIRLQARDVDLPNQKFKLTVWKRNVPTEVWKPIKDIAVPFWEFAMKDTRPDDYVFSAGFKPGPKPGDKDFISQTWRKLVKSPTTGLGIDVRFYSLKGMNLDEIATILDIKQAAKMADHTTPVITMRDYAIGEADRQAERLRKVSNPFV